MRSKKGYGMKKGDKQVAQVSTAQDRADDINILKMIRRGDFGPMNDKLREAEQKIVTRLKKA